MTPKLYEIVAPREEGRSLELFSVLYGILKNHRASLLQRGRIALEISASHGRVSFYIWIDRQEFLDLVVPAFRSAYEGVEFREVEHDPMLKHHGYSAYASIGLRRKGYYPIRTTLDRNDLLNPLIEMLARPHGNRSIYISLVLGAKSSDWRIAARRKAFELRYGKQSITHEIVFGEQEHPQKRTQHTLESAKAIEEKAELDAFDVGFHIVSVAGNKKAAWGYIRAALAALETYSGTYNGFRVRHVLHRRKFMEAVRERRHAFGHHSILNTQELAALWHLPMRATPHVEAVRTPKLAPPMHLPTAGRVIGRTNYPDREQDFALSIEDGRRHLHVLGPSGSGKSVLLLNLIMQDLNAGRGVAVLDPKSDLIAAVLERMPEDRMKDVVLIEPDNAYSVGLNILEEQTPEDVDLIAEEIVAIMQRIYSSWGWGPRMNETLKVAFVTLLKQNEPMTLGHVVELLTNKNFRRRMTANVKDAITITPYWRAFEEMSDAERTRVLGAAMSRIRDVLMRDRVRRILCQRQSTFSFEKIMNYHGVLLVDLNDAKWGPDTSSLLGSLVFSRLWQTGKKRANTPEPYRRDFMIYVDEFQQFLGSARDFENVLAQARGFRISLTLANQYLRQLPDTIQHGLTNARSRIVFQTEDDGRTLARDFPPMSSEHFMHLGRYEIAARLSLDTQTSQAFTAMTFPPPAVEHEDMADRVREASRQNYARPVEDVDAEALAEFVGAQEPPEGVGKER